MHDLFRVMCSSFMRMLGGYIHVHQKNNQPLPKQYLLISNHPSGYDLLLINSLFKVKPLAQHGVRKWFLIGRIAESIGTVFVKRDDKNSRNSAKEACRQGLKEGKSVLIYPEGGCYGKNLNTFKNGAFELSLTSNTPIVPVYLLYEAENCFEWGWDDSLPKHLFDLLRAKNKHIHCYVFDAIDPKNFDDVASYKEYVYSMYQKLQNKYRDPHSFDPVPVPLSRIEIEQEQVEVSVV